MCVFVVERERERESGRGRERKRERVCVHVLAFVFVAERKRERERERECVRVYNIDKKSTSVYFMEKLTETSVNISLFAVDQNIFVLILTLA